MSRTGRTKPNFLPLWMHEKGFPLSYGCTYSGHFKLLLRSRSVVCLVDTIM